MKKNYFVISLVVLALVFMIFHNTNNTKKSEDFRVDPPIEKLLAKIKTFEPAIVMKTTIDATSALSFPGSFIFVANSENIHVVVFNSLPSLYKGYSEFFSQMQHGNITLLETDKGIKAIMPKHMFGDDVDLVSMLEEQGFKPGIKGDLVTLPIKRLQDAIKYKPFDVIKPNDLDGVSCTIKTLNCFNDKNLYQYNIQGTLHYLSPDEQKMISRDAKNSFGKKAEVTPTDGLYVISVPNSLFKEIPGMSGGSAVVNVNGENYFLGINTHRLLVGYIAGVDTIRNTLMAIQPVISSDLN